MISKCKKCGATKFSVDRINWHLKAQCPRLFLCAGPIHELEWTSAMLSPDCTILFSQRHCSYLCALWVECGCLHVCTCWFTAVRLYLCKAQADAVASTLDAIRGLASSNITVHHQMHIHSECLSWTKLASLWRSIKLDKLIFRTWERSLKGTGNQFSWYPFYSVQWKAYWLQYPFIIISLYLCLLQDEGLFLWSPITPVSR